MTRDEDVDEYMQEVQIQYVIEGADEWMSVEGMDERVSVYCRW